MAESQSTEVGTVIAQFRAGGDDATTKSDQITGPQLSLPLNVTPTQLQTVLNKLLENDEERPYSFYVDDVEINDDVSSILSKLQRTTEEVLTITYQPQALFRVKAVSRCSASLTGHSEAVLSVQFSPDGRDLCTGSGDTTVRVWDINTQLPRHTLRGHKGWILCIAWSPNGKKIASGSMDGDIRIWDPVSGNQLGLPLKGHKKHINALAWAPLHLDSVSKKIVSASKDSTLRIWDSMSGRCLISLSGHTMSVTCVRWSGEDLIYSGGQDRLVKVWAPSNGKLVRELKGHAHWVNTMALSTDYALRTGGCDVDGRAAAAQREEEKKAATSGKSGSNAESEADTSNKRRKTSVNQKQQSIEKKVAVAKQRYNTLRGATERLVTGSDDFTMLMWNPSNDKKPLARLLGHQQLVNDVRFSPDGGILASASFDKSIRLWNGVSGKFIATLRGHVGAVFQLAWSADCRMLVSGSRDSTLKVWLVQTKKMLAELPGHADEVYAVDWAPDGGFVASGSKDRVLKLWRS